MDTSANIVGPWTLSVLAFFRDDPVVDLERRDPPTHALVRAVYLGCSRRETAIVEFELIDSPPPPVAVVMGGVFEAHAFAGGVDQPPERPWYVFDAALSMEANVRRLRQHVVDAVSYLGRHEVVPLTAVEPLFAATSPTASASHTPTGVTSDGPPSAPIVAAAAAPAPPARSFNAPPVTRPVPPPEPPPPSPQFVGQSQPLPSPLAAAAGTPKPSSSEPKLVPRQPYPSSAPKRKSAPPAASRQPPSSPPPPPPPPTPAGPTRLRNEER